MEAGEKRNCENRLRIIFDRARNGLGDARVMHGDGPFASLIRLSTKYRKAQALHFPLLFAQFLTLSPKNHVGIQSGHPRNLPLGTTID